MIPDMTLRRLRIDEALQFGDVMELHLNTSTDVDAAGNRIPTRLEMRWNGAYSAQLDLTPGPECKGPSRIISQIQQMGQNHGAWSRRFGTTVWADGDNGEAVYCESSLTGGAPDDAVPMPVVHRLTTNEPLMDVIFHPGDNSVEFAEYYKGPNGELLRRSVRKPARDWLEGR